MVHPHSYIAANHCQWQQWWLWQDNTNTTTHQHHKIGGIWEKQGKRTKVCFFLSFSTLANKVTTAITIAWNTSHHRCDSRKHKQREGEGEGKWVMLPPIPPSYIFLSIIYVCILSIFVAGHILRLRRGCPLILQTQPAINKTGRAPLSFNTLAPRNFDAGRMWSPSCTHTPRFWHWWKGSRPCSLLPLDFNAGGRNLPPAPPMGCVLYNPLKPLPLPATNLYLWVQVQVSMGKGTGSPGDTPGLPMPLPTLCCLKREWGMMGTCPTWGMDMGFWWVTHTIDIRFYRHTCVYYNKYIIYCFILFQLWISEI